MKKKIQRIVIGLFIGATAASIAACYTSGPTPPCSINSGNPGCYPFPSDLKKKDAGANPDGGSKKG